MYFSDVIRAYKGLLKEKEVLEASLSALTSVQTKTENADTEVQQNSTEKENGSAQSEASANSQQKDNEQVIIDMISEDFYALYVIGNEIVCNLMKSVYYIS